MKRKLLVTENGRSRELLFVGTMAVGRDPECDISGSDPLLSRRHAEFVQLPDRVIVRDLQSRNGITLNGKKVEEAVLRPGDRVQVAAIRVEYVEEAEAIDDVAQDDATIKTGARVTTAPALATDDKEDKTRVVHRTPPPPPLGPKRVPSPSDRSPALPETAAPPLPPPPPPQPKPTAAAPLAPTVSATDDLSLKLRSASQVARLAQSAPEPSPLPSGWTMKVRVTAVLLALVVFAVTVVPITVNSTTSHIYEVLFAGMFAVVAALMAAYVIERATLDVVSAIAPRQVQPTAVTPAARKNAELPLQEVARS